MKANRPVTTLRSRAARLLLAIWAALLVGSAVAPAVTAGTVQTQEPTADSLEEAAPSTTTATTTKAPSTTTTAPDTTTTGAPSTTSTDPETTTTTVPASTTTTPETTTTAAPSTTTTPDPVAAPAAMEPTTTTTPIVTTTAASSTPGPSILLTPDPTMTISIDKTNTADGDPPGDGGTVEPGDPYTYNFEATCSNINVDCVDFMVVDTFPTDVVVDESTIPASIPGFREVTYDPATQTLTVVYVETLDNPPGSTGKAAGTSDSFIVSVTLPADTTLEDGTEILNEATVSSLDPDGNPTQATDPSDVVVSIPREVGVETSKTFTDPSAIGGDVGAPTTIQISSQNQSTSTTEVTEMVIEDTTADTFEYLDFTGATVTQFPEGADQAQLFLCPSANAPCDADDDFVAAGTATPPAPATLDPAPVDPGDVVGVRIVFTDTDGSFIANDGTAAVDIDMALRETVRSTGDVIAEIPETTNIDNTATSTVTDPGADPTTATDDATAQFQILPPTLIIEPTKTFFPDENGNFSTNSGEHAVIGENSGVSMLIDAENASAFPIAEIVIIEPSPVAANEFDKFNATSFQLTFPAGAANANVVVTYDDATSTETDYAPPGPGTVVIDDDAETPPRVTSITVTYTGPDVDPADGEPDPTIEPDAVAGLGVHGNLNDGVVATDLTDGVLNCARFIGSGGGVPGTTGTSVGDVCATLPIEDRNGSAGGDKTASQATIPPDQPIVFRLSTENNGNLSLFDVVVSDPPPNPDGTPPLTPTFENLRFIDAAIDNDDVDAPINIEVFIPGTGWVPYPGTVTDAQRALVIGVRATTDVMTPTENFDLLIEVQARFFADPDMTIDNCYAVTSTDSDGAAVVTDDCSPPLTPIDAEQAATVNKAISPETVPERIPGLDSAVSQATVSLRVQNTGTLTAQFLQITDNDTDFWDAVDFVGFGTITPPATGATLRADLIQVDAFVDGDWVNGTPVPIGSAALPDDVTADEVRGLRFTFSSTLTVNDGYVITPCNEDPTGGCAGVVEFDIVPRLTLVSNGEPLPDDDGDDVPDPLLDTATGAFNTQLAPEGTDIPPVTDDLNFVPGDPALDVNKTPENTTVQPGQLATFNLVTTNTGTANLPDVTVSDPLPTGILFDDTFADPDTGQPFTVTWSNLPDGYPEPPEAVFEVTPDPNDPTRVGLLRWTFPDFEMPPNATVTIFYRYTLEPGVTAGQEITNTMGASSPVDDLACSDPNDDQVTDGEFGDGLYCTDPANVTVTAGANFVSRKWVAGNPDLGWYNESTGELVAIGEGGCLSLEALGRTYTTNPCIAIVNPGEDFHYVLRVQNAGTESAAQMTVVDTFPAPGDTGVFGADRGTQWATAPTLAGPAVYISDFPAGQIEYTTETPCAGGSADWPCDDATWTGGFAGATALRMIADFDPDPLPPGGTVEVLFSMTAPTEVPRVSDPTIAYNSLAHGEILENGTEQQPLEPLKVGVATLYGNLEVVKEIGQNPADLPLDDVEFTFSYDCTIATGAPGPSGTLTATPTTPGMVTGIPSGSTCEVWETGTNGGIPDATEDNPAVVVIEPSLDPDTPVVSSVTVTNDFPLGNVALVKTVADGVQEEFAAGPYLVTVNCTDLGVTLPGFPVAVEVFPGEPVGTDLPVGSTCTFVEREIPEGVTVTYDPANADGTGGEVVVPPEEAPIVTVGITNTFSVGSLVIVKEVSGPGVPEFSGGPFTFDVTCDYLENTDVFSTTVEVPGSTDGTPVESDPVTGLPVGAVCTVTEIDNGGADETPPPVTVTIEAGEEAEVAFANFDNPFSAGSISVVKVVDGTAADSSYVDSLSYTIGVECAVEQDGDIVTVLDEEVDVAGDGEPVIITGEGGDPLLVPLGARCWASEAPSPGATAVTIDHDSYENGVEVVADADGGVQPLQITVTNTFDAVNLSVSKDAINPPDADATYTFVVSCVTTDGTDTDVPILDGSSPVQLADGGMATLSVLAGSQCIVTEDDPGDATVTFAETGDGTDDDTDGIVIANGDTSVAVTNTYDDGGTADDEGGQVGPLPFTGLTVDRILGIVILLVTLGAALVARSRRLPDAAGYLRGGRGR